MTTSLIYVSIQTVQQSANEDDGTKNKMLPHVRTLENKIQQNIFQPNDISRTESFTVLSSIWRFRELLRSAWRSQQTFLFLFCFVLLLFFFFFLIFLYRQLRLSISPLFLNQSQWNLAWS